MIGKMAVDVKSVCSISHSCQPELCKDSKCCCSCYEVRIDKKELSRIVGCMPAAAKYAKNLISGDSFLNIFEDIDDSTFAIERNIESADIFSFFDGSSKQPKKGGKGFCVFSYFNKSHPLLCSLHSAALEHGLPVTKIKPRSCLLWPLAISDANQLVLTVQSDAFSFPCNEKRKVKDLTIDEGIKSIIRSVLGNGFLKKLNREIKAQRGRAKREEVMGNRQEE